MAIQDEDHPVVWITIRLVSTAVLAVLIEMFDRPLFATDLPWRVCVLTGLALGFGGWLVIVKIDDDTP
jgi:hypothetical protein